MLIHQTPVEVVPSVVRRWLSLILGGFMSVLGTVQRSERTKYVHCSSGRHQHLTSQNSIVNVKQDVKQDLVPFFDRFYK